MNVVVLYDSWYGNTERLAKAIATECDGARLVKARVFGPVDLHACDLLLIGSPTHGGSMSFGLRFELPLIRPEVVRGMAFAAFDTRFHEELEHTGSAAVKVTEHLEQKGAKAVVPPESFFVHGMNGPLEDGELDRATIWAASVYAKAREAVAAAPPR